jgi:uncharacterized protein
MKPFGILMIFLMMITDNSLGQQRNGAVNNSYDSLLARKVGADEYGMKTYYFVFLKRGHVSITDSLKRQKIQNGHLKNNMRLASENKMILAGPFLDDQEIRGIFIFNASSRKDVEEWLKTDPAIKSGILSVEIHPWYGSAALMELGLLHNAIQKHSIAE